MTRKTKASEITNQTSAEDKKGLVWGGFVNVDLDTDEKAAFKIWVGEVQDELMEMMIEINMGGLKFSTQIDSENDCVIATFTGAGAKKAALFSGALSARGKDWYQATALLVFKHVVICEGDWSKFWKAKRNFGSELD